jgi:hypothetical protein
VWLLVSKLQSTSLQQYKISWGFCANKIITWKYVQFDEIYENPQFLLSTWGTMQYQSSEKMRFGKKCVSALSHWAETQTWPKFEVFFGFAFRLQCRPKRIFSKDWNTRKRCNTHSGVEKTACNNYLGWCQCQLHCALFIDTIATTISNGWLRWYEVWRAQLPQQATATWCDQC